MKYISSNHIIGKVYDLTQDNMNAMIKHIEYLESVNKEQALHIRHLKNQISVIKHSILTLIGETI